ncbi:MAG: hypothetical protein ACE5G8_02400, partial [Anaerolineae bacterium]
RTTAGETPVGGGLGVTLQGLAWDDELDRLIGGFEKLYAINTATGAATEIGGDYTTGAAGDGVYGLAYLTHIIPLTLNKALDSTSVVTASATITYTITIMNNGANPVTNTTVSDAIPANATYNPGSATANPAIALTNFPGVTPPFTISAGSGVVITYTLEVTGAAKRGDVLTNTATVSAPALSTVLTDSETNLVDPLKTFLPMVFNQQ